MRKLLSFVSFFFLFATTHTLAHEHPQDQTPSAEVDMSGEGAADDGSTHYHEHSHQHTHDHSHDSWIPSGGTLMLAGGFSAAIFLGVYAVTGSAKTALVSALSFGFAGCSCCGALRPGFLCPQKLSYLAVGLGTALLTGKIAWNQHQAHDDHGHRHHHH